MKTLLILLLRGYKFFISPLLGNHCRFYPSCSEYMATAIGRFGAIRGLHLGLKRLGRCHPGCQGGIDHVPEHWPDRHTQACSPEAHQKRATQDPSKKPVSTEYNAQKHAVTDPESDSQQPENPVL